MKPTLTLLGASAILFGGVDASTLREEPIQRVEQIAGYEIKAEQKGNKVETTFPWKDQKGLKVVYDMGEPTTAEKIKDKRKKEVITEVVDFGEGGFKVDILLNEKPDTNRFCYEIQGAENYDFFYQPPLTAEEIAEGASRPPEIEGSYAVYHKTLKNHEIGKENYATGKVMHIPRPQVWEVNDQANTTEWADLSYENGQLCVTASQDFWDSAKYPVRVDPTFGYTTAGVTPLTGSSFVRSSFGATPEVGAILQSITFFSTCAVSCLIRGGVYRASGLDLIATGTEQAHSGTGWGTSIANSEVLGTEPHYAALVAQTSASNPTLYYDTMGAAENRLTGNPPAGTTNFPNPGSSASSAQQFSVYATYYTIAQKVQRINNGTIKINNGTLDI